MRQEFPNTTETQIAQKYVELKQNLDRTNLEKPFVDTVEYLLPIDMQL